MARRATFYEESRANADFRLIVDAGAFCHGVGEIGRLRSEYMVKGLGMLEYDVINLSVRDLNNGGEFIKKLIRDYKPKFVSANIRYKESGKLFVEPYTIINLQRRKGGSGNLKKLKVGVLGLCEERSTLFSNSIDEKMLESRNPVEAAKEWLPKLRKKCDILVLLAHMKFNILQQVLHEVQGVDVIAMGGGYYRSRLDSQQDSVIIVKTPTLGKYAGQLLLKIDQNKKIVSHTASEIALSEKIADHPDFAALVKEVEKAEKEYRQNRRKITTSAQKDTQKKRNKD